MGYFSFAGWFAFAAWILADTGKRYIMPRFGSLCDTLDELSSGGFGAGRWGSLLSRLIQIIISVFLSYILTIWPVWSVLRCVLYTRSPDSNWALYFITGFIICEYPLGSMAKALPYRGFFMSTFHFAISMGAYIVFSINMSPIKTAYPWLVQLMGIDF
ncbi:hypothetical protein FACS1894187_12030 [Synergistales bacterium]|nr:hypothetical protein FACS1894187_12030 [Synergistales bacterium]